MRLTSPRRRHLARAPLALGLAASFLAASFATAQTTAPAAPALNPAQTLPTDPDVSMGTLPNGIRYYIRVNREPAKRAELRLAVNAGSVLEDEKQLGLAHFTEHMAFNGTRNFAKNELVNYLQGVGVQFGAHLNAYTGFDETVYILPIPTDSARIVEKGFQILADWAGGQLMEADEVNKERGVVIEEWRGSRGAGMRMAEKQLPVLLRGSLYAQRLPIGNRESLAGFDPADLRRFYQDWYRPDNMAVMAVGDFDKARVEQLIRQNFGSIPARAGRARPVVPVPDHEETLVSVVADPEATNTSVEVTFKQPVRETRTVADYRRNLVERLYNEMLNARFDEMTQKPDAPFSAAFSSRGSVVRSKDSYTLFALVKEGGVQRGLEAILTEAERVNRHGFTASELERARADLLRASERAYTEREKTRSAVFVSQYVDHFLEGAPIPGPAASYEITRALVPGITLAEVNQVARALMTPGNRVISVSGPEKAGVRMPAERELLGAFEAVRGRQIAAYEDRVATGPLVATPPRAGRVVSDREMPGMAGVREWRLSNGVRVLVKPTDFKADEVLFRAYSPGGTSLLADRDYSRAFLASTAASVGGVGQLSATDLQKALAGKTANVSPYISGVEEGLNGSGSPRDLETMLQLAHLYFTAPRVDSAAFMAFQEQGREMLRNRSAAPMTAFQDTFSVTMAQGHPRSRPLSSAMVDSLDLGTSMSFYRDRFSDASDFTFVFVGSVDPAALKPMVETYLGSLPARNRKESPRDLGVRPPTGVVRKTVRRGTEPQSMTRMAFTGPVRVTPEETHALRSLTELMRIRLVETLRERLGGTYSPSVNWGVSKVPVEQYTLTVQFGSAPERVDELVRTVLEEITRLQNETVPESDINKVREAQRRDLETSLRQNAYWLNNLVTFEQRGWDPAGITAGNALADRVTAQSIRDAARKFLNTSNYVLVSLFPEQTAAAPATAAPATPAPAAPRP